MSFRSELRQESENIPPLDHWKVGILLGEVGHVICGLGEAFLGSKWIVTTEHNFCGSHEAQQGGKADGVCGERQVIVQTPQNRNGVASVRAFLGLQAGRNEGYGASGMSKDELNIRVAGECSAVQETGDRPRSLVRKLDDRWGKQTIQGRVRGHCGVNEYNRLPPMQFIKERIKL